MIEPTTGESSGSLSGYSPVKLCYSCGDVRSIHEFRRKKYAKDGRQSTCKICEAPVRAKLRSGGGTLTSRQWVAILDFYGYRCLSCGTTEEITLDHVVPVSLGGTTDVMNVQPLCFLCNCRKYNKTTDYRESPLELAKLLETKGLL